MEFVFNKLRLYTSKRRLLVLSFLLALLSVIGVTSVTSNKSDSAAETIPPVPTVPETIPTTTTTLPPQTTTTLPDLSGVDFVALARGIYGKCGEYHDLAIQVGWPEEEWPRLQQVMWRESRCITDSWNGADAGLTQINQVHSQWLSDMGWSHPDDMFNPEYNLTFALRLWETSGWKPWRFSGTTWGD
jgi:Transglycosylase SLT domain